MPAVRSLGTTARRVIARRRRWYWPAVAVVAVVAASSVAEHVARLDSARSRWKTERVVWVASTDLVPGDTVFGNARPVSAPLALIPKTALETPSGTVRQRVDAGTWLTSADVTPGLDELALAPDGWGAIAVVESVASGALVGERVAVVSEGIQIVDEAVILTNLDDGLLVAVPPGAATVVAAAVEHGDVTLVRWRSETERSSRPRR